MKLNYCLPPLGIIVLALIAGCSKSNDDNLAKLLSSKLSPTVTQCQSGYHWDYTLNKCVPNCPSGYINNSTTGACVDTSFSYTGTQLFNGIFFLQGTVAQSLPYYSSLLSFMSGFSSAQNDSLTSFMNRITTGINTINPNYFNYLRATIQGNNADSIMAAIDLGANLVLGAAVYTSYIKDTAKGDSIYNLLTISSYNFNSAGGIDTFLRDFGNKAYDSSNYIIIPDKASAIFFAAVVAVALWDAAAAVNYAAVANALAVINVYAAVFTKTLWWPKKRPSAEMDFERETFVSQIQQYISTSGGGGGSMSIRVN